MDPNKHSDRSYLVSPPSPASPKVGGKAVCPTDGGGKMVASLVGRGGKTAESGAYLEVQAGDRLAGSRSPYESHGGGGTYESAALSKALKTTRLPLQWQPKSQLLKDSRMAKKESPGSQSNRLFIIFSIVGCSVILMMMIFGGIMPLVMQKIYNIEKRLDWLERE